MRPILLALTSLLALAPHAAAASDTAAGGPAPTARELFLAGGSLAVCSDLSPRACEREIAPSRQPPRYALIDAQRRAARAPALWTAPGAPSPERIVALIDAAAARLGKIVPGGMDAATLERALAGDCGQSGCAATDPHDAWSGLLDSERSALFAALELPAKAADGTRPRERAYPADSRVDGGVQVLQAFVAAARARSGGRPRIAFVTASAFDPLEPVDFYASLFAQLDADAVWWPVDAAIAAARFEGAGCAALPRLRLERLRLPGRERVYPDLVAQQQAFCRTRPHLLAEVHGVFFAGGDQWRLRQAFIDADGRPNDWLRELRSAHAAGRIVVGGTSAGAAVQSGAWMLSNGSVEAAVLRPIVALPPPEPGCARGDRCGALDEEQLTLWPDGGLGLAEGAIVDTHFSERGRELRLLLAMQAAGARWGYGADEASALHLREAGGRREIRALGERGGWVLQRSVERRDAAIAWYLAPGATLVVENERAALELDASAEAPVRLPTAASDSAFAPGALRGLAQSLAGACAGGVQLPAGTAVARLRCLPGTRGWRGPKGMNGVGPLALELERSAALGAR